MADAAMMMNNDETAGRSANVLLPVDPFRSLFVHFGMLLGVDDFETVDAYHRGKVWMHSAWLHREGTVWGLRVVFDQAAGEIRVSRGLAVDALGRELYLEQDACLNIASWYKEHKEDPKLVEVVTEADDGTITFNAYVEIRFKGCLARQVPALNEPCEGADSTTAYSRVVETVELSLIPGDAPDWRMPPGALPYHRLRLLFGLEAPIEVESATPMEEGAAESSIITDDDQHVLERRAEILELDVTEQPAAYLDAFREFAALDEMDLVSVAGGEVDVHSLFPERDPAPIALAGITNIKLQPSENGWTLVPEPTVDNSVRPVHVPTSTIQELLCGPMCRCTTQTPGEPETPGGDPPGDAVEPIDEEPSSSGSDAGGPRADPDSVSLEQDEGGRRDVITFEVVGVQLLKSSVAESGIIVTSLDIKSGWRREKIDSVDYQYEAAESRGLVTITLDEPPSGNRIRLIVKGTGDFPLLGHNDVPLAGAVGGSPGGAFNGHDFVHMFKRGG